MTAHCPNPACGKSVPLTKDSGGHSARCPHCRTTFAVPNPTRPASRAASDSITRPGPSADLPATITRFQVRARLGAGAFGAVYRAYDPDLEREVALKVPHPGTLDNPRVRERFLREAKAAAGLFHPHIVPVYDAGRHGEQHYLASAFIPGRTLADALAERPFDFDETARIVQGLAEALAYAHKQGVVHRDVKPANVMLDERGEPHLMDFGLAYKQDEAGKLTQDGALLGTPAYMAPEQARGQEGEPLPASDQYSLGVVLYELLTGRTPFSGPPQIVLFNVLHQEPPPPRAVNPDVPRDLETVCLKAMAQAPAQRYDDCRELANDLRRFREDEPVRARRVSLAERLARWVRRQPLLALASAAAALSLLAVALVPTLALARVKAAAREQEQQRLQAEQESETARQNDVDAREKTRLADEALKDAIRAEAEANAAREKVGPARANARREEARAKQALKDLKEREKVLRRYQYVATINLVQQALEDRNFTEMYRLLDEHTAGEEGDPRGFEWHYFRRHRQNTSRTEKLGNGPLDLFHYTADGQTLVAARPLPGTRKGKTSLHVYRWGQQPGKGFTPHIFLDVFDRYDPSLHWNRLAPSLHWNRRAVLWLSADGLLALEAMSMKTSGLWRGSKPTGGAPWLTLQDQPRSVTHAVFAPDGKTVATLHLPEPTIILWDTYTGKERGRLSLEDVWWLSFSPDSKLLAATTGKQIVVWRVATRHEVASLSNPGSRPVFAPDGRTLAYLDKQRGHLWDLATKKVFSLRIMPPGWMPGRLQFAPDGRTLAIAYDEYDAKRAAIPHLSLWDVRTGERRPTLAGMSKAYRDSAFSPDGKLLAGAFADGTVLVWDIATGQRRAAPLTGHGAAVGVAFSPDGRHLAAAWEDGTVTIRDRDDLEPIPTRSLAGIPSAAAFCGKNLFAVATGKTLGLWDTEGAVERGALPALESEILCTCGTPDGKALLLACRDGSVKRWDMATRKELAALPGSSMAVHALAVSPDGKRVVGGQADGGLVFWDAVTGALYPPVKGHTAAVRALAFTADGNTLVSAGADNKVKQWNVARFKPVLVREYATAVNALALHGDGKTLATAGDDGTVRLWDLSSGKERTVLKGHRGRVLTVAFTPDGKTLASAGAEGTIKLWEPVTGQELATLAGHEGPVLFLAFQADGSVLASAGQDRTLRFWDGRPLATSPKR